jgi:alpha-1,2-mannosyltransferase
VFRQKILIFALTTAIITDIGLLIVLTPHGFASDFAVYWRAADLAKPYALSSTPFANPPTALVWLQPLRLLPLWPSYIVWSLAGLMAYVWCGRELYGARATFLGLLSPAVMLAAIPGQMAIIVAALVFLAFSSPPVACGILLAVAGSLKPQMVLLAPVALLAVKDWKGLAAFVLTALALAAAATLAFGVDVWPEWFGGIRSLVSVAAGRHALLLAVSPLSFAGSFNAFVLLAALVIASICAAAIYLSRNLPPGERAAALVASSLFASPYALSYDMAALAPFAAAVILRDKSWRGWCGAVTYTAAFGPLCLLAVLPSIRGSRRGER